MKLIADWYEVRELKPNLYEVHEPADTSFFVMKSGTEALFIDSGVGLDEAKAKELLNYLKITTFKVVLTHAHFDHVGLNYLATDVYMSDAEWKKYEKQKEWLQLGYFYKYFKDEVKWPKSLIAPPTQHRWKPNHFVTEDSIIKLGPWELHPQFSAGHTSGHTSYFESSQNLYFIGDLAYDGTIYLHMPDSSLADYEKSLKLADAFMHSKKTAPLLLPNHNTIPLSPSYLAKMIKVLGNIKAKQAQPDRKQSANEFFEEAVHFTQNGVKFSIKPKDL